jgi:hypothetical protein
MWAHHKKCGFFFLRFFFFPPSVVSFDFFYRVFWAFRNKGSSKTRFKKIPRKSPPLPKKRHLLTYVAFFLFRGPPCFFGGCGNILAICFRVFEIEIPEVVTCYLLLATKRPEMQQQIVQSTSTSTKHPR